MEHGEVDFGMNFPVLFIPAIDTGAPITVLAGVHSGCFELFAGEGIRKMAVGGLPEARTETVVAVAEMALTMLDTVLACTPAV
jgi:hypothetical protein